jgi:signal transduction histidine kinase
MKLRERFVFTLVVITLILATPAVLGLFALNDLRDVAENLSSRDAVGALALGRLQAAFRDLDSNEKIYIALANQRTEEQRLEARRQIADIMVRVESELSQIEEGGYDESAALARQTWDRLKAVIAEEQRLVETGDVAAADQYRTAVVNDIVEDMDLALTPIGLAINERGVEQAEQARDVAERAATTTLLALTVALAVALVLGGWLTRSLLVPIQRLRRGMAVVAGGDFEPQLAIAPQRPDEIGDLAHSFHRMTEQLAELDRLKAEFVSVASHELKTPLSVIKGYLSLLIDGIYGDVSDEQRKILASVGDQTDRLARLIQQLLDVSRFEAGGGRLEIKEIELRPFLEELATSFEALAVQNEIDFGVQIAPDLPATLQGDADRLNEVIGNLLSNAFKFTPRNGRIRMRAGAAEGGIGVEISDTGVGVPEDKLPRIFEKFFQVENDAQPRSVGSGLGLAISREIVDAHGGTISAESKVGKGTTIRVFLPLAPPVHAPET